MKAVILYLVVYMTVKELIEILSKYSDDYEVVVSDSITGGLKPIQDIDEYNDIESIVIY